MKKLLLGLVLAIVASLTAVVPLLAFSPPAQAAPGDPGNPSDPTVLFTEDFENGVTDTPSLLTDYVGANGFTYTAAPYYLNDAFCNGVIFSRDADDQAATACSPNSNYYHWSRAFAEALGSVQNPPAPGTNHAVVDFTTGGASAAGMVHLETENTASLNVDGRFLSFSIDVAEAYCNQPAGRSRLSFFLLDGPTAHPAQSAPVVPCTDPSMQPVVVTGPGDASNRAFSVGTVHASGSVLFTGSDFGFRVVNDVAVAGSGGNDVAFDNLRVLDVTPQLDKSYATGVPAGFGATLTFTVTNTSELSAKNGWSFTENLPAGVSIASVPNFTTTCTGGAITAGGTAGATSVGFSGSLDEGQASCTITIDVVTGPGAQEGDTFTSQAEDSVDLAGLEEPGDAVLTVGVRGLPQIGCVPAETRATQRWWYFGNGAGLDFGVSGTATPALTPATGVPSQEGTTVVTDAGGQLLFWSDGIKVLNRNHQVMPNGSGLTGNSSATQTVAAFPSLTQPGKYFVVSTTGASEVGGIGRLVYSVVDMALNGGLGDVTATKNVPLEPSNGASEQLTAIPNATGDGFWVVTAQASSPNVRAYLFDGDGPADPDGAGPLAAGDSVVSVMPTPNYNEFGTLNLSPDLSTVLLATGSTSGNVSGVSRIRLMDFDATTGRFAQRFEWETPAVIAGRNSMYSADFSPSGDYVYATRIFTSSHLFRYTLAGAADGAAVKATEVDLGEFHTAGGQVKRGPDGRMYLAKRGAASLGVVADPDAADSNDVGLDAEGLPLAAGTTSQWGLPQMATGCPTTPGLETAKSAALTTDGGTVGKADAGDVITYTFTVSNTGYVDVTDVSIDDPMPGLSVVSPASVATLAAGDDAVFTATYEVSQADVDNGGQIANSAIAQATGPDGAVTSPPGTADVDVVDPAPSLLTDKEASLDDANGNGVADEGETITYSFTVRNNGNVTIEDVAVDDPMVSGISPASATIAPGGQQVFTADDYVVTQADIDNGGPVFNRASSTGTAPDGGDVTSPEDTTSTETVERAPGLSVAKEAELTTDGGTADVADVDDVITYTFTVTNTGNVTMTNVSVADPMPGLSPTTPLVVASLEPGDDAEFTATYTVVQDDVDAAAAAGGGAVENSATAGGDAPDGTRTTSTPSEADIDVVEADPGLSVNKTAVLDDANGNGVADAGETIDYSFHVVNTGNVTMSDVAIDDPMPGLSAITPASVAMLAPSDDVVFTASYTVEQSDVDAGGSVENSATAGATSPDGEEHTSTPDETGTGVVEGAPGLILDKISTLVDANGNGVADLGEEIAYTFEVTNTGNVTISGVTVSDPEVTGIAPATATIGPGQSVTFTADPYVVTQGDIDDGVVHNVAGVSAQLPPGAGGGEIEEEDVDEVTTVVAHPDLAIVKDSTLSVDAATPGKADVDDVVTYTFTVTNNGGATAFDVRVSDVLPGLSAVSPSVVASLAPGDDAVFTATYTVTRADVKRGEILNQASVAYVGPTRGGITPPVVSTPSNTVGVETGRLGGPSITTKASSAKVSMAIGAGGVPRAVKLYDNVTISGFVTGGDAQGRATLYGPTKKRSSAMCTPGNAVKTVSFDPRNGTFRTPSVSVAKPGYYTWVVSTTQDRRNDAATHACGLAAETTLVHRAEYGGVRIETGFTGTASVAGRKVRPARVSIGAVGMSAKLDVVGIRKGQMVIPGNVKRGGWLRTSAAPGERVGSTVIAGHVSDRKDRPGAFGKIRKARKGQVVTVRGADGTVQRYRITKVYTQKRTKGFSGAEVSTTGAHQLVLVTCTGKVTYPNGRYHYTKNHVVVATPIS